MAKNCRCRTIRYERMLLLVAVNNIDSQAKSIAQELNIDDSTQQIAKQQAFNTLKDHKDNFANHPTCRFINSVQSELGKVSKQILDNINSQIRKTTKLNQWKNTPDVTNWFTSTPDVQKHSFVSFTMRVAFSKDESSAKTVLNLIGCSRWLIKEQHFYL